MGLGGMVKIGPNTEFFSQKIYVTTKHKSDHQFESVDVRIIGIKKFHSIGAVDDGFGHRNTRGTVGHLLMVIVQSAP